MKGKNIQLYTLYYFFWFFLIYISNYINNYFVMFLIFVYLVFFRFLRKKIFYKEFYVYKKDEKINYIFGSIDYTFLIPYQVYKHKFINKNDINECFEEKDIFNKDKKKFYYPFFQPISNLYDVLSTAFSRISVGDFTFVKSWIIHILIIYFFTFFIMNFSTISLFEYLILGIYPSSVLYNYIIFLKDTKIIKKIIKQK